MADVTQAAINTYNLAPQVVPALIGIGGIIIGGVLTFLAAIHQQRNLFREQRATNRLQAKQTRGEELYTLLGYWRIAVEGRYPTLAGVMKGELDYNQHLDTIIANSKDAKTDPSRLTMLADVYFAELHQEIESCHASLAKVNKVIGEHKAAYKRGNADGQPFLNPYQEALQAFGKAVRDAQGRLAATLNAL